MKRVGIIGAGDLGIQIAHHTKATTDLRAVGFFDDTHPAGSFVAGLPVFGGTRDVMDIFSRGTFDQLLIAIGYKHLALRSELYDRFCATIPFATLIHPATWIDPTSTILPGTVIYPGCTIDMHTTIGVNALLNVGCVVAHHSKIGSGCFLSPAVKVAGFVQVAAESMLGIGTVIIDNVTIARGVRTGAGTVVIDSLLTPGLYVGVPAKLVKNS